jgi:2'-5' RNA ligase
VLSAVVIAFPDAAPVVDAWRERTSDDKPSMGIPPHVTLLFPFVAADVIDEAILGELGALFTATPPFAVSFPEVRRWPGVAYLAPEPQEPFSRLTDTLVTRWPDYPPYEGIHETVIPHLTVAYGDEALLGEVEADVLPQLPIDVRVADALLLGEVEPRVRWRERARFPLGR